MSEVGHPLLFLATPMPESQPLMKNYTSFTVLGITIWGIRRQGFIDRVGGCLEIRGIFTVAMHVTEEVKNKSKMSREDGQELLLRTAGCELLSSSQTYTEN